MFAVMPVTAGDKYVDRGDPSSVDFATGDITQDGTYRDLDLSAIIPKTAKLVLLRVIVRCVGGTGISRYRKNGNTNDIVDVFLPLFITDENIGYDIIVPCDKNGIIEYNIESGNWSRYDITVAGWWV